LREERISALGQDANMFASLQALAILTLLGYSRVSGRLNLFVILCLLPLLAGSSFAMMQAGSRTAIVALSVGFMFLLFTPGRNALRFWNILVALAFVPLAVLAISHSDIQRLRLVQAIDGTQRGGRDEILHTAQDMFLEKPLIGWGPVAARHQLADRIRGSRRDPDLFDTHNLYTQTLVGTGLLGTSLLSAVLLVWIRAAWRSRKGVHGSVPLALTMAVLAANMGFYWWDYKVVWLVMSYALAAEKDEGTPS